MTTIREKIMAIEPQRMNIYYQDGHADAKRDAADIAEAEVARLEARVRELEEVALAEVEALLKEGK